MIRQIATVGNAQACLRRFCRYFFRQKRVPVAVPPAVPRPAEEHVIAILQPPVRAAKRAHDSCEFNHERPRPVHSRVTDEDMAPRAQLRSSLAKRADASRGFWMKL